MYHVKEYVHPPPGNLDLNVADEEEFSPDKLRANIERLYMTVGLGMMGFGNQIARLRSWREKRRTTWFCTVCHDQRAAMQDASLPINRHILLPGFST